MAKKYTYYFSHDFNARGDEKIIKMRMRHGAAGYGVYWMLIEKLAEVDEHRLKCEYEALAFDLRVDAELVRSVVEDFNLFVIVAEEQVFYSKSLTDRLDDMEAISKKRSDAVKVRWEREKAKKSRVDTKEGVNDTCVVQMYQEADTNVSNGQNGRLLDSDKNSEKIQMYQGVGTNEVHLNENFVQNKRKENNIYVLLGTQSEFLLSGIGDFFEAKGMTFIPDFATQTTNLQAIIPKMRQVFGEEFTKEQWLDFLNKAWDKANVWEREHFNLTLINQKFGEFYNRAYKKVDYGTTKTTNPTADRLAVQKPTEGNEFGW